MTISVFDEHMGRQLRTKLEIEIAHRWKHEEERCLVAATLQKKFEISNLFVRASRSLESERITKHAGEDLKMVILSTSSIVR